MHMIMIKWLNRMFLLSTLLLIPLLMEAQQSITGYFPVIANQKVKLFVFEGFSAYPIDSITVTDKGFFQLSFSPKDYGVGYLATEDGKAFIVILTSEDISLKGESLAKAETVEITSGIQNQLFAQYAREHPRREQALNAWEYLEKIYHMDSLFTVHKTPLYAIEQEKQRLQEEDKVFLAKLGSQTYVSWFLPVRKLVSSVSTIAQYRTNDIPATIKAFRNLDYTDERLYISGLLREIIESHFWLIENSGRSLDSVFIEMKISIDYMIENLSTDAEKFNRITDFLFKLLEKRSLYKVSEYLALKVLNEEKCTIDNSLALQLESYRAMKVGKIAPDLKFNGDIFGPAYVAGKSPDKLSDINANYIVLVFGASWCPACPGELMKIAGLYQEWEKSSVEVVFVSLDENHDILEKFVSPFPFISICDYQKWESPIVKSYHVFATPTLFLLDQRREILLRPNSVHQLNAWIDWYLVQGSKAEE